MVAKSSGRARKAANPPSPPPVPGLVWATSERDTKISWAWPGIIQAGSVVVLEGRKGTGKSSVSAAIAASISGQSSLPGWKQVEGRPVIWAASEEHHTSVVIPRFVVAGGNKNLLSRPVAQTPQGHPRKISLPGDLLILEEMIKLSNAGLVVLDPYISFADPTLSMKDEQQARLFIEPLIQLMEENDCICLLIRHLKKGRGGDIRDQGLGGVAIGNASRSVLRTDEHPFEKDHYILTVVACNESKKKPSLVFKFVEGAGKMRYAEWLGECELTPEEIAEGRGNQAEKDEWTDADSLLIQLIGESSVPVKNIMTEAIYAAITPKMLRASKARLGIKTKRVSKGPTGHWEWYFPKGTFPTDKPPPRKRKGGTRK